VCGLDRRRADAGRAGHGARREPGERAGDPEVEREHGSRPGVGDAGSGQDRVAGGAAQVHGTDRERRRRGTRVGRGEEGCDDQQGQGSDPHPRDPGLGNGAGQRVKEHQMLPSVEALT
jgi:hypothetical protein